MKIAINGATVTAHLSRSDTRTWESNTAAGQALARKVRDAATAAARRNGCRHVEIVANDGLAGYTADAFEIEP